MTAPQGPTCSPPQPSVAEGLGRWGSVIDPGIGIQGPGFQDRRGESHLVSYPGLLMGGRAGVQEATGKMDDSGNGEMMTPHHSFENGPNQGAG